MVPSTAASSEASTVASPRSDPAAEVLRVGLDASALVCGDTGVAEYARQHLLNLAMHDDVSVVAFALGRGPAADAEVRRLRVPLRLIHRSWQLLHWPTAETLCGSIDVVHSIDMVPPPSRCPLVMTVHDALPLDAPHLYGPRFIQIATAAREAARRASVVVTTCEATAERLVARGYAPRDRIVVAPLGPRRPLDAHDPVVAGPYVLAVGSITPRKGFEVLARAIARLGTACPPVLVVGPDGWRADEVRKVVVATAGAERVRFLGRVDDEVLERLYRNATLFCAPSLAEGFGIPLLEAMAFGVPVVASDIPSFREIADGVAELVTPGSPEELGDALLRVLGERETSSGRRGAGRARAASFSWAKMTERIVEAYRLALS